METRISASLKSMVDQLVCYKSIPANREDYTLQCILNETIQELKSDSLPISEDIEIQKIPASKPRKSPLTDQIFKITNLDTGKQIDIRNENDENFLSELLDVVNTGEYSETMNVYFSKKREMNRALWLAIENNQHEICKLLLSRKNYGELVAQTNARAPGQETSLHIAAKKGNLLICEILLEFGEMTDVNAKDINGCTPLHLSCQAGHYLISQLLIRSGTHINSLDNKKNTPMHYAVLSHNEKLIKYLFTKFGNLNSENEEGVKAIDLLNQKGIKIPEIEEMKNIESFNSSEDFTIEFEAGPRISFSFQDFEAIQMLGRGSFGEVFLVKMRSTGQKFAMKVLRKDKIVGQNLVKYAMVERNVLSFIKHPFIVSLSFAFQSPQKLYLVLDYCAGGNLTSYILRQRFFSEAIAKFYLCEIILALEELHLNGIIYRDLKPDNVVIDGDGHAMLTDFGLSKQGISDNMSAKSFCGSIAYLAPEMIRRKGHGKAVDWYLLGVIFYEMLVGIPPFYSNNKDQLFYNIEHVKPVIPNRISPQAGDLIKKLLKKDPEKRLGSKEGASSIKSHHFFSDVNWENILKKTTTPPLKPIVMMIPGYIPRNHVMEDFSLEPDTRHLEGWSFIGNNV